jgi:hypothetical protein
VSSLHRTARKAQQRSRPACTYHYHTHTHNTRAVWQSHAHASAIKADPAYAHFAQKRQALALTPAKLHDVHVPFSGNPRRTLEAPVTEVDIYRTQDAGAATTQGQIRRITYRVESLQMQGFVALSWGVALEDGARGVYLGGWRTIEVSFAFCFFPHAL